MKMDMLNYAMKTHKKLYLIAEIWTRDHVFDVYKLIVS